MVVRQFKIDIKETKSDLRKQTKPKFSIKEPQNLILKLLLKYFNLRLQLLWKFAEYKTKLETQPA